MHRFLCGLISLALSTGAAPAADWFQFRGPAGDGHADNAKLPTEWGPDKNITWRKELPGKGWSSPVVVAGRIYLTTAVPGSGKGDYSLRALCLDAGRGDVLWDKEVFNEDGKTAPSIHTKNSHASPTALVADGRVYVHFGHQGTACLNASDGAIVWVNDKLKYTPVHGNGGSPVLAGDKLIFAIDGIEKQAVIALDKATGKVAWETPRKSTAKKTFSFCTPLLIEVKGQPQVVAPGSDVVMGLDPATGAEIWRVRYSGYSVVPKPVFAHGLVILSTGYDSPSLYAIRPDGRGDVTDTHVAWTVKKGAPHNPSPLVVGDALYIVSDGGVFTCLDVRSGKERWAERIGGNYSASPLYAGGLIYLLAEDGTAMVLKPGSGFESLSKVPMKEKTLASYGVDGNALLLRTEKALYRIEEKRSQ